MFTLDQIKTSHSKVKSGADFPAFIADIKALGVTAYDAYVSDGHIDYFGEGDSKIKALAKYEDLIITEKSNAEEFKKDLKAHQNGLTDYATFCSDCAKSGIEKWTVRMQEMTCTYYDKSGKEILVEEIPTLKN